MVYRKWINEKSIGWQRVYANAVHKYVYKFKYKYIHAKESCWAIDIVNGIYGKITQL